MKCTHKTYLGPRTRDAIYKLVDKLNITGWHCCIIKDDSGYPDLVTIYKLTKLYYYDYYGVHSSDFRSECGEIRSGKVEIKIHDADDEKLSKFLDDYQFTERRCDEEIR